VRLRCRRLATSTPSRSNAAPGAAHLARLDGLGLHLDTAFCGNQQFAYTGNSSKNAFAGRVNFAFSLEQDTDMSLASFAQAHAARADWRVALAHCQKQLQIQIAERAAQQGDSAAFTLGWCYLSDYYAPAVEAILEELRLRFPGVAWVGTVGVGVAASGARNAEAAQLDLVRIATEIRAELEGGAARHMAGAVYVSCSGRGGPHFGARHAELQVVRNALGDVPLVGFFAGGEIARHHLYGYTGVLTVFTTPA
jgi:hypothetical protein